MKKVLLVGTATLFTAIVLVLIGWFVGQAEESNKNLVQPAVETGAPAAVRRTETMAVVRESEPAYQPPVEQQSAAPSKPIKNPVSSPGSLADSDAQVLVAIADLGPALAKWLIPNEQIRKWVLTVDLMADGKLPKRYRPLDYPMAKFAIEGAGDNTAMADSNYPRLGAMIEVLATLDPKYLARYYHQWSPILEKAYKELGKPGSFDQRLHLTINRVLESQPLTEQALLARPSVLYRYADPRLEEASDVEKLLWRVGPDNSERIQDFVRELRYYIDQQT